MATAKLAVFASGLRPTDIPPEVVGRTQALIRDDLGIALFASHGTPWGRIVADVALQETADGTCTVIGYPAKSTASMAALANGTMILGFELEDTTPHAHAHIGPPTIAAALAMAEKTGASGAELMTAIVAGYEVMGRIGRVMGRHLILGGFHPTANLGAFGAATAAARLLGVDQQGMLNALGLASVQAGGTMQSLNEGAMARRLYGGRPAQSGVIAAELASRGFTGPHQALEGKQGFFAVYAPEPIDEALVTDRLGDSFDIMQTTFKPHASCQVFHASIDAMLALRQQYDLIPSEIDEIVGEIKYISPAHAQPTPETVMAAQYSLPYCLAAALHCGQVGPAAFSETMLHDPQLRATAERVRTTFPPEMDRAEVFSGRVTVRLKDGQTHSMMVPYPKGDPHNPLSSQELDDKFNRLASTHLATHQVDHLASVCERLATLTDVTGLTRILADA
jgi:2-methylcitrate dehydratase PrpD